MNAYFVDWRLYRLIDVLYELLEFQSNLSNDRVLRNVLGEDVIDDKRKNV